MILNYTEPQLNIDQILASEGVPSLPRQAAVIVGAQYVSPGFESNFEYEEFSSGGGQLSLTFTDDEGEKSVDSEGLIYKLDTTSLDVRVKDAEYDLFTDFDVANGLSASQGVAPSHVVTAENLRVSGAGTLWTELYGRPISLGDTVYCYNAVSGGDVQKRKVTGFIGKPIASTHGTGEALGLPNADTLFSASVSNPTTTTVAGLDSYEVFDIVVPGNYDSGATIVTAASASSVNRAVNMTGLSYMSGGAVYAGVKLSLRVTSYNSLADTGTVAVTSSDGSISTTATFANATGELTFDLSASQSLHGISEVVVPLIIDTTDPSVGEVFSFTVKVQYEPVDLGSDITSGTSDYTGLLDNTFYVKVVTGSQTAGDTAQLQVYDARGSFTPFTVSVPYATPSVTIPMGSGMECVIDNAGVNGYDQTGFRKNDIYFINAVAAKASTTEFTGLTLDGPATTSGTVAAIKVRGIANGSVTTGQLSGTGFELNNDGVSVDYFAGLTWYVPSRSSGAQYVQLVDGVGSVYANWKAVKVPSDAEGKILISSAADLTQLGPIVPGNDIAFAAKIALDSAAGNSFYALRTAGETETDIAEALTKIENTDLTYALAIISGDKAAFFSGIEHAQAMSANNVKNFRRVYFGVECPAEFTFIDTDENGDATQATVTAYDGVYKFVTFTTNVKLLEKGVRKGDIVAVSGYRMVVDQVVSETELLITNASAPNLAISPAVNASIIKPNTAENQASYVIDIAKAAGNRRGSLIWCDSPVGVDSSGTSFAIHPKFIAAEVAALRSATAPQLGLSRTVLNSVSECPAMYAKYKRTLLNQIASNGVMIITQENEGGDVFIRHQLTTDSDDGSLFYEDSVGVNVDNLSFKIKDVLDKYVGRRNVTPTTLGTIRHDVFRILEDARTTTIADLEIGPQIINFYDEEGRVGKVTVKSHPTFKDRILVKVRVAIPLPMNVIEVEIEAVSEVVVAA